MNEHSPPPLNPPRGGGTFGDMEARVSVLEAHVEHIMADIASVKTDVSAVRTAVGRLETESAVLTERATHLPGYAFVVSASILIVTALTAVIVFSDQIQSLLGTP